MSCKCGQNTWEDHHYMVKRGDYAPHVYSGRYWAPTDDQKLEKATEDES